VTPPHVCTSCGRACRACAEAAAAGQPLPHTIRAPFCRWCTEVYAENAPAEDGYVYCQNPECPYAGTPFPGLAELIERGVPRYPAYCRDCRSDGRRAPRLSRERSDPSVLGEGPRPPLRPEPADPSGLGEGRWSRGGFRPRLPGPDRTDSEHGDGATVWPGNR
jgi:hypothetical protein